MPTSDYIIQTSFELPLYILHKNNSSIDPKHPDRSALIELVHQGVNKLLLSQNGSKISSLHIQYFTISNGNNGNFQHPDELVRLEIAHPGPSLHSYTNLVKKT